jgi:hypothetical protein
LKLILKISFFLIFTVLITSCASTITGCQWPLKIESNSRDVKVQIKNKNGQTVFSGYTPSSVNLKGSYRYFKKEDYTVKLYLSGKEDFVFPVKCKINEWYWFNIFIGGVLGMLIVDPLTGAMFKLDRDYVYVYYSDTSKLGIITNKNNELNLDGNRIGDIVRVPNGFTTIPGKIVGLKKESVIVEYEKRGKIKTAEIYNYMLMK